MDGASSPSCRPSMRSCRRPFSEVGPAPGPLSPCLATPRAGSGHSLALLLGPRPGPRPLHPERVLGTQGISQRGSRPLSRLLSCDCPRPSGCPLPLRCVEDPPGPRDTPPFSPPQVTRRSGRCLGESFVRDQLVPRSCEVPISPLFGSRLCCSFFGGLFPTLPSGFWNNSRAPAVWLGQGVGAA